MGSVPDIGDRRRGAASSGAPGAVPEAEAGALLTVDLGALARNWRTLRDRAGTAECAAVVKADGYGLGLEPVGRALWAAGARTFFVAHLVEGRRLREALPQATIYVLNGLPAGTAPAFAESGLRPVLGAMAEIEEWAAVHAASPSPLPVAIHVDTGMNRLGLSLDEADGLSRQGDLLSACAPALVMSHFACADTPSHHLNQMQAERFERVRALFPGLPASLANSAAVLSAPGSHHDLARPGIALYGAAACEGHPPLETVATLEARIVQVRRAAAGETVGYGATRTLRRESRIAVLSVGYADGYLRAAGGDGDGDGAAAIVSGKRAPLLGRVSMDLIALDVTDIPEAARGGAAELFGAAMPIDAVAKAAGTIGYELLTGLGARYARRYVD